MRRMVIIETVIFTSVVVLFLNSDDQCCRLPGNQNIQQTEPYFFPLAKYRRLYIIEVAEKIL
jgi:hypothetical protein